MNTFNRRIGSVYLPSSAFNEAAAETIGQPALSEKVIFNRRSVKGKLNEDGKLMLANVAIAMEREFNVQVEFKWDRKCGCTMCPCSPGFKMFAKVPGSYIRGRNQQITFYVNTDGQIEIKYAKSTYSQFGKKEAA